MSPPRLPPADSTVPSSAAAPTTGLEKGGKQMSRGRQKIEIAAIGQRNKKHVTFSKRRLGLFKKASELCVLCGADIAIVTFSEAGKAFCFGHPSADAVIQRYLQYGTPYSSSTPPPVSSSSSSSAHNNAAVNDYAAMVHEYNEEYKRVKQEIKRYSSKTTDECSSDDGGFWWEQSVHGLELHELEQYLASLKELRDNVIRRAEEIAIGSSSMHDHDDQYQINKNDKGDGNGNGNGNGNGDDNNVVDVHVKVMDQELAEDHHHAKKDEGVVMDYHQGFGDDYGCFSGFMNQMDAAGGANVFAAPHLFPHQEFSFGQLQQHPFY